jgi:C-terminal processing protease CtpA/Prc
MLAIVPIASCDDNNDTNDASGTLKINTFIHDHMDYYYYWNEEMPNIDYKKEADSEDYFYKLLKNPDDRWSFITDDIAGLENYFKGIFKSPGYSIQAYFLDQSTSNQVIIIVEYVYRNSPASEAGLKRGDIFYKINGEVLTNDNFQELLSLDSKVITLGQITAADEIIELEPAISISSQENLVQHPILATNIIEKEGTVIGYLAYNSFIDEYDEELSEVFTQFKTAGVNELVLDLRYNSGGAVSTAQKMAGMIVPASAHGQIFIREKFNLGLSRNNSNLKFDVGADNLNLDRVYILTTEGTASASEMIIYGLEPYMEVIQIGAETHGKYYASFTISDNRDPQKRTHNWAIQPIVIRSENANNSINYQKGLAPDVDLNDTRYNAELGDEEEHFLAAAIEHITTGSISTAVLKSASTTLPNIQAIKGFKQDRDPLFGSMYLENPLP